MFIPENSTKENRTHTSIHYLQSVLIVAAFKIK